MVCMTNGDIHNLDRRLERTKTKIQRSSDVDQRDKKLLLEGTNKVPSFLTFMLNQGISKSRIERYLGRWKRISEYTDWKIEEVDNVNLSDFIGNLQNDNFEKIDGGAYSDNSKREIKKAIRKMFTDYVQKYRRDLKVEDDFESEDLIEFTLTIEKSYTDPERLPTPFTVKKLLSNTTRPRDKAYISLLWSTGGRHGEVLGLKWGDVSFTGSIGTVTFKDTKTGGDHTVPMGESHPFMKEHMESDKKGGEYDEYIFRSTQSDSQISGAGGANIIKRAREDTDINPEIKTNPHAFRKGRTSYWARQDKNESWICEHMNWKQGNNVVAHYCRIAQEDITNGVAEHLGIDVDNSDEAKEESRVLTPSICHKCKNINKFDQDICGECGEPLDSGDLFEEHQIEEKTTMFMQEVISSETRFEPEELDKKAREFVKKELDI